MFLAVLDTTDATADRGLAFVVLAQILRIGQYGLQELQGYDLNLGSTRAVGQWCLVFDFVDTAHADILNHVEVFQILFAEGHPETSLFDGGIVLHQRLQLFVVQQITLTRTDVGVGEWLVDFQRLCLNPLAILIVESLLGNLADVDLWVEVRSKGMVVITSVAVYDVEIMDLVEVVLGSVCCIDTGYAGVETTAKNSR